MRLSTQLIGAVAILLAGPGRAADQPTGGAALFNQLAACRSEADSASRLACYDSQVARLVEAEGRRDIVVVDREKIRETRRSLFGLSLPAIAIFESGKDKAAEEIRQVDGVVSSARADQDGRWLFRLEDGARWQQIDSTPLALPPTRGDKVVIRRAALGSFMLRLNGARAVRVRRIN